MNVSIGADATPSATISGPTAAVRPARMHPGGSVQVTIRGLKPGARVRVRVSKGPAVSGRANSVGTAQVKVMVPWNAQPGASSVATSIGGRLVSTPLTVGTDWVFAGRDRARTSSNPFEKTLAKGDLASLRVRWSLPSVGSDWVSAFAVKGNHGYGCTRLGRLFKMDLTRHEELWSYQEPHQPGDEAVPFCTTAPPYVDSSGDVWMGEARFDDATGERINSAPFGETSPFEYRGLLIEGGAAGSVGGFVAMDPKADPAGGTKVAWRNNTFYTSMLFVHDTLYGGGASTIGALDPLTGKAIWEKGPSRAGATGGYMYPATDGQRLLAYSLDGSGVVGLTGLSLGDGKEQWRTTLGSHVVDVSGMATADGVGYAIYTTQEPVADAPEVTWVVAWSTSDGHIAWRQELPHHLTSVDEEVRPVVANGVVYIPDQGGLLTLDAGNGEVVEARTVAPAAGYRSQPPVIVNGHVYVLTSGGFFDLADPRVP